jgi:hypothetical protein
MTKPFRRFDPVEAGRPALKQSREPLRSTSIIGRRGNVPVIAAPIIGSELRFFCDWCEHEHVHSLGDGLRVAQCKRAGSPYAKTGYYLRGYTPNSRAV